MAASNQPSSRALDLRRPVLAGDALTSGRRTYQVVKNIGGGASAQVFLGMLKTQSCALKLVPNNEKSMSFLRSELHALEILSEHPYIISLNFYGLDVARDFWFLDLDLAKGGDGLSLVQKCPMSEDRLKDVSWKIFKAMEFAHAKGICHRDIKLENLLFQDAECTIPLIADWGMSSPFNCYEPLTRDCGSLHYAAPEILGNQPYFGDQVDAFSTGILIFALSSGCFPFTGKTPSTRLLDIISRERLPFPRHLSHHFRDLCCSLVETDPRNRCTFTKALLHPWFDEIRERDVVAPSAYPGLVDDPDTTTSPSDKKKQGVLKRLMMLF